MQIKCVGLHSRLPKVVAGYQEGLEPILDGGSDRNEDFTDATPDEGY